MTYSVDFVPFNKTSQRQPLHDEIRKALPVGATLSELKRDKTQYRFLISDYLFCPNGSSLEASHAPKTIRITAIMKVGLSAFLKMMTESSTPINGATA